MPYTEKQTQEYYNKMNAVYTSFWDKRGSVHWGYFKKEDDSLEQAYDNLTEEFIKELNKNQEVLNIGCGNGYVDLELAKKHGFNITGIDLSQTRIQYAKDLKKTYTKEIQDKVTFLEASATNLPFKKDQFSQIISQATFYHVHDKKKLFDEIYRVLKQKGLLVFDDLFKPKENISQNAQKNVYDRLLFDTPFSYESYKQFLENLGFTILHAKNLSSHMYKTYAKVKKRLENINIPLQKKLIKQYEGTLQAIKDNEVGWGMFVCMKK